jgi:hypothetical protein
MPYASHHLAMMIWKQMLAGCGPGWALDYAGFAETLERWRSNADQVYQAMVEDLAVVLARLPIFFDQPHVLRDIAGAFRGGRLIERLALWFDQSPEPHRIAPRYAATLTAWKQRHVGRGHQLDLAGAETGDD